MKLLVIAVGHRMPAWVDAAVDEYAKRMPREMPVRLVEVRPEPRAEGAFAERLMQAEGRRIQMALPPGSFKVVLDERGRACTTRELAQRFEGWQMQGRDVAFVVGGPDGLSQDIRRDADWLWSLTPLTLPHGLVRVVLAEQLYRACTILKKHPYHRE